MRTPSEIREPTRRRGTRRTSFARRLFCTLYTYRRWMPQAVADHLGRVAFYDNILRAFQRHLPPITLFQVLGLQPLKSTKDRSTHVHTPSFLASDDQEKPWLSQTHHRESP